MSTTPNPTDDRLTCFENRKIPVKIGRVGRVLNPLPGRAGPKVRRATVVGDASRAWSAEELPEAAMLELPEKAMEAVKDFWFRV